MADGEGVVSDPATMTVDEVARLLSVSRKTVYEACGRGELPHRRLGKRIVFSRVAIHRWLEQLPIDRPLPDRTGGWQ